MSTPALVAIVVVALLVALAIGGAIANARRQAREGDFDASVDEVNRHLAAAHAADKGWEPTALAAAARRAFESESPGVAIHEQSLVAVIDPPGTEEDKAVFRFRTDAGEALLTLGRRGHDWVSEGLTR
jgi:hypothetical protein